MFICNICHFTVEYGATGEFGIYHIIYSHSKFTNPGMVSMAQSVDLSVATIIEHAGKFHFQVRVKESNVVFKVFLERAPRLLEELGAGFIMLSGCLVPLVKFCTRNQ